MDAIDQLNEASPSTEDNEDLDNPPLSATPLDATLLDSQAFELENELENELESMDQECPHLLSSLSIEINRVSMLRKYKSAVVWVASNSLAGVRARKRRKVSGQVDHHSFHA